MASSKNRFAGVCGFRHKSTQELVFMCELSNNGGSLNVIGHIFDICFRLEALLCTCSNIDR